MFICLQYLLDICGCVSLSRSLVILCCQKLVSLYELNQRLEKTHVPPALTAPSASISTPGIEIKVEPQLQTLMETACQEEDSVFNDQPPIKPDPDQRRPSCQLTAERKRTLSIQTGGKETNGLGLKEKLQEEGVSYFSWCGHHSSLMLQLSSIIQTVAVQCPTAFVHCRGKSSSKDTSEGERENEIEREGNEEKRVEEEGVRERGE